MRRESQQYRYVCCCPKGSGSRRNIVFNCLVAIPGLCLPAGGAFFSLLAQRKETAMWLRHTAKERAALPLRLPRSPRCGTGGAKKRVGLPNWCSLRSNSLPLHPVPHLAARLSANGPPSCPDTLRRNKPHPGGADVCGGQESVEPIVGVRSSLQPARQRNTSYFRHFDEHGEEKSRRGRDLSLWSR